AVATRPSHARPVAGRGLEPSTSLTPTGESERAARGAPARSRRVHAGLGCAVPPQSLHVAEAAVPSPLPPALTTRMTQTTREERRTSCVALPAGQHGLGLAASPAQRAVCRLDHCEHYHHRLGNRPSAAPKRCRLPAQPAHPHGAGAAAAG